MQEVSKGGPGGLPWHTILPQAKSSVLYLCSAAGGKGGWLLISQTPFSAAGQPGLRFRKSAGFQNPADRQRRKNEKLPVRENEQF